jgi:hypothetical protein
MAGVMRVAWSAILEQADGHEHRNVTFWVKVPGADRGWVFGEVKWAAWEASQPWDDTCSLQWFPSDTAQGPVVKLDEPDDLKAWLQKFAAALENRELTGEITLSPQAWAPWFEERTRWPRPVAIVGYRLDEPWGWVETPKGECMPPHRWRVGPETTDMLVRHACTWGDVPDSEIYLRQGMSVVRATAPQLPDALTYGIVHEHYSSVLSVRAEPLRGASVSFAHSEQVIYLLEDPALDAQAEIDALIGAMTLRPELVDLAVIAFVGAIPSDWTSLEGSGLHYPERQGGHWERVRHLWNRYVPDAHAVQLLTTAHLEHASDLSDWNITEVAPDRYLVQARDLTPWIDPANYQNMLDRRLPAPEVLVKARADFGGMITTSKTLKANPPPVLPAT